MLPHRTPDLGYDWKTNTGRVFNYFCFGAACSEVEIDCLTGDHQVGKLLSRHVEMPRHINCQDSAVLSMLGRKHRVNYFETAVQHKIVKRCEINRRCSFTRPGIVLRQEFYLS